MSKAKLVKRLVREVMLVASVLTALGAAAWWANGKAEEARAEAQQLQAALFQVRNEEQALRKKVTAQPVLLPVYETLFDERGNNRLALNRDVAAELFQQLRERYPAANMRVVIDPVEAMEGEGFKNSHAEAIRSKISINMQVYTDVQAFQFMQDIVGGLPGAVRFTSFGMNYGNPLSFDRQRDSTSETRPKIGGTPQVDVQMDLLWYGLRAVESSEGSAQASGASAP